MQTGGCEQESDHGFAGGKCVQGHHAGRGYTGDVPGLLALGLGVHLDSEFGRVDEALHHMQPKNDVVDGGCVPKTLDYYTSRRPEAWSAALVPVGTARFIVENSAHTLQRRRSNVAHEMSHLLLEYPFEGILFADGGAAT
ncbi:ImmA/IrrE family metallo-endopeptidase [Streptomyces sp. NPDC001480]|uniref:ImmA/IrrE family metallo-endopeptidase n=1 Tax=Streptomyces sp. NPDC001480 TaxID=3364577 RepID=UPI00367484C5